MLKDNSKRLPLLNHNWKRLILTITKNWIRFWIHDIQSEVFTIQYEQNKLCFSRHLRILRYEQLKEFSKLLMFCLRRFAQIIGLCFRVLSCCYVLQVFIPIYRGLERRWKISRYINLSCLKLWFFTLDLLPDLIVVLWRTNFKSIPLQKEQNLHQSYSYPCLDVETKIAEMLVAELVVVHFVHCPLSTLVK